MLPRPDPVRRIILRTDLPPGDVLMLTAAVRDLHRSNPGAFATDVRTGHPDIWTGSPWITPLQEGEDGVELVEACYTSVSESSHSPRHIVEAFGEYLSRRLGVSIRTTEFRGDVHLTDEDIEFPSAVRQAVGSAVPYWLIVAGGKSDFTVKWWSTDRWQAVVDALRGRVLFVRVGASSDHHPALRGVVDLRGRTTIRDLIRLTHHADGVLCPITFAMHLAATVERPLGRRGVRPCVVVAGGREPAHWFSYPGHQVLHRVGALDCCRETGCWVARTRRLGDGSRFDDRKFLCRDVDGDLPRCMSMIEPQDVVRAVEVYLSGGASRSLTGALARPDPRCQTASTRTHHQPRSPWPIPGTDQPR